MLLTLRKNKGKTYKLDKCDKEGRDRQQLRKQQKSFLQREFPHYIYALNPNSPAKMQLQISVTELS